MSSVTYRLLDLDNCIADDRARIPLIDWSLPNGNARYARYHEACNADPFANEQLTRTHEKIIVMTGRPVAVYGQTKSWLNRNRIQVEHILMRNNHDERRSCAVKELQLIWLEAHYDVSIGQITSAFDDHPEIIEMYKSFGIPATQVSVHNVSAYLNPFTQELTL